MAMLQRMSTRKSQPGQSDDWRARSFKGTASRIRFLFLKPDLVVIPTHRVEQKSHQRYGKDKGYDTDRGKTVGKQQDKGKNGYAHSRKVTPLFFVGDPVATGKISGKKKDG